MSLDPQAVEWLALGATLVAVLALVLALVALVRLGRLRRTLAVVQGDSGGTLLDAVARASTEVGALRGEVGAVQQRLDGVAADLSDALRHVAVVRYDAFNDMGGRLSFSAALLDDAGDGLVLTSINGRTETRTYSKGVKAGSSEASLSPEEEQAIGFAMRGRA